MERFCFLTKFLFQIKTIKIMNATKYKLFLIIIFLMLGFFLALISCSETASTEADISIETKVEDVHIITHQHISGNQQFSGRVHIITFEDRGHLFLLATRYNGGTALLHHPECSECKVKEEQKSKQNPQ